MLYTKECQAVLQILSLDLLKSVKRLVFNYSMTQSNYTKPLFGVCL